MEESSDPRSPLPEHWTIFSRISLTFALIIRQLLSLWTFHKQTIMLLGFQGWGQPFSRPRIRLGSLPFCKNWVSPLPHLQFPLFFNPFFFKCRIYATYFSSPVHCAEQSEPSHPSQEEHRLRPACPCALSTLPLSPWPDEAPSCAHCFRKCFHCFPILEWDTDYCLFLNFMRQVGYTFPQGWSPSLSILSLRLTHGSVSNYGSSVPSAVWYSMYEDIRLLINAYLGNVHLNKQRVGTDLHPPRHLAWLTQQVLKGRHLLVALSLLLLLFLGCTTEHAGS